MTLRMKHLLLLSLGLLLAGCASPPRPAASLADVPALVAQKAKKEMQTRDGPVVVGRVHLQDRMDATPIVARTQVRDDGWFAAALHPSRQLAFRAHGYEPLDIPPPAAPGIVRIPDLVLKRVPAAETAEVRGRIIGPAHSPTASVKLVVAPAPPLWQDSGYESGANFSAVVDTRRVPSAGEFTFSGLAPIEYELHLSAPGCTSLKRTFVPDRRAHLSLGDIALSPAPKLVFEFVSQFKSLAEARGFPQQRVTIECTGDTRFRFTNQRDSLGNALYLRLAPGTDPEAVPPAPVPGQVKAGFWYSPAQIHDLGKISLVEIIASANDALLRPAPHAPEEVILQPGHTYFFECPDKNATCLFSVQPAK